MIQRLLFVAMIALNKFTCKNYLANLATLSRLASLCQSSLSINCAAVSPSLSSEGSVKFGWAHAWPRHHPQTSPINSNLISIGKHCLDII